MVATAESRVESLPVGRVCTVLTRVVRSVENFGAHPSLVAALADAGLVERPAAPAPGPLRLAPLPAEATPAALAPVAAPATSPLARILATPLPAFRGNIRRLDRKERSAQIRKLLRGLGLASISVTTPDYSMASSTDARRRSRAPRSTMGVGSPATTSPPAPTAGNTATRRRKIALTEIAARMHAIAYGTLLVSNISPCPEIRSRNFLNARRFPRAMGRLF